MYERFTDRARKVMQFANQEAQRFCHEYVGTEHILLGLIKEGSGVGANVIKNFGVDLRKVRLEVEKLVQSGPDMVTMGKLPQTPRAKKVIEYSMEEARQLNHNYVGTEHILLGLLREEEGIAGQVLVNLGLNLAEVRDECLNLLGHGYAPTVKKIEEVDPEKAKQIRELMDQKEEAIANQDFESAAKIRDMIDSLTRNDEARRRKAVYQIACLIADCMEGNLGTEIALTSIAQICAEVGVQ
jgi:ATP-dependent Clp protease ATP-binding subunit ClpA